MVLVMRIIHQIVQRRLLRIGWVEFHGIVTNAKNNPLVRQHRHLNIYIVISFFAKAHLNYIDNKFLHAQRNCILLLHRYIMLFTEKFKVRGDLRNILIFILYQHLIRRPFLRVLSRNQQYRRLPILAIEMQEAQQSYQGCNIRKYKAYIDAIACKRCELNEQQNNRHRENQIIAKDNEHRRAGMTCASVEGP